LDFSFKGDRFAFPDSKGSLRLSAKPFSHAIAWAGTMDALSTFVVPSYN